MGLFIWSHLLPHFLHWYIYVCSSPRVDVNWFSVLCTFRSSSSAMQTVPSQQLSVLVLVRCGSFVRLSLRTSNWPHLWRTVG